MHFAFKYNTNKQIHMMEYYIKLLKDKGQFIYATEEYFLIQKEIVGEHKNALYQIHYTHACTNSIYRFFGIKFI